MLLRRVGFLVLSLLTVLAVGAQPSADFTAGPVSGCAPLKVDFTNNSANAVTYLWRFGNGNISTLRSPSAVYNAPGRYTVTLVVTAANGTKDSMVRSAYIEVFKSPVAALEFDKKQICAGEQVAFSDRSARGDGMINSWKWDFGDGGTSSSSSPAYRYATPGNYDVTLAVRDNNGCEHQVKVVKAILVHDLPSVSFTSDAGSSCKPPLDVNFDATVSGKYPLSYDWRFGDGGTATSEDPSYTYRSTGTFNVSLTVSDGNKCSRTVTKTGLISVKPPVVSFTGPVKACVGEKVKFSGSATPDDGTGSYEWVFSNGDNASGKSVETIFSAPGKYRVELRYNWKGCQAVSVRNDYIEVFPPPSGRLVPGDTAICRQRKGFYHAPVISNAAAFQWTLNGSGHHNSGAAFPVPLAVNAVYRIAVFGVSAQGCRGFMDSASIVVRGPVAGILAKPWEGCLPLIVNAEFNGKSAAPIASYEWNRPTTPPSAASGRTTTFTYDKFGRSSVWLKVTDINGCSHDTTHLVQAGLPVKVSFKSDVTEICRNQTFGLTNLSSPRGPDSVNFSYQWTSSLTKRMQDSVIKESRNRTEVKLMGQPGAYDTLNVVANSYGCISRLPLNERPVVLIKGPYLEAYVNLICNSDSLVGLNMSTNFTAAWWRWKTPADLSETSSSLNIRRSIGQTSRLWLFAEDSKSGCRDSMHFPLMINTNPLNFSIKYDCAGQRLETVNHYPDVNDGSVFRWEFINQTNGRTTVYHTRNVNRVMDTAGRYTIRLTVSNPAYPCDKKVSKPFRVLPGNLKGSISIDRNTCFPVELTLRDPDFRLWSSAVWRLDGIMNLKDSAAEMKLPFQSYKNNVNIVHDRVDSNGCRWLDTFTFRVDAWNVYMNVQVDNASCSHAVLKLRSYLYKPPAGATFTYTWNVNGRIIRNMEDTVHVRRSMTVPIDLLVTDDRGCTAMSRGAYKVQLGKPVAAFSASNTQITCPPLSVNFRDESNSEGSPIVRWNWDFGDKTGSSLRSPGKLYIYPGRFRVTLVVTNALGCSDTMSIPDLVVVKGPEGSFTFDRRQGCTPLNVNLSTSIGSNVSKFEFDMGDGNVLDTSGKMHRYLRPGMYIPRLILTDSVGCRFSPPPTDTIFVYANPVADFYAGKVCENTPHVFRSLSRVAGDSIVDYRWTLNAAELPFKGDTAVVRISQQRHHRLNLQVGTAHGCRDTMDKPFTVFRIQPMLQTDKEFHCLGEKVLLQNRTVSDTNWAEKRIWINGVEQSIASSFSWPANQRGAIPVRLYMRDVLGCVLDTTWPALLKVGDTLPPPPLRIYRSTVNDDYSTNTLFKPSAEPDFKEYRLQAGRGGHWFRTVQSWNRHDTDLRVNGLQTLHNSYCHRVSQTNFCGKSTDTVLLLPHCTVETKAVGDTNSAHVWWSAYSGWPVRQYRIYRKLRSEPDFVLLDSVPGNRLRYTDTAPWCHVIYDYRIEAMESGGFGKNSFSDTAMAIPVHFRSVPAPEVWRTTVDTNAYTRTEWIMPVSPPFPVQHFDIFLDAGKGWELFRERISPDSFVLNDFSARVNRQSYAYRMQATDVCNTVSGFSNPGVSIFLQVGADPSQDDYPRLTWNAYERWNEGVEQYIVQRSMAGGPFLEIGRTDARTTAFTDKLLPRNCFRGIVYKVIAVRSQPAARDSTHHVISVSNWADFVPDMKLFIPNAFTPNANGLNESFAPVGVYIYSYNLRIYDRWGKKVYDGSTCGNAWDGMLQGEPAPDGVYAYAVEAWDMKGKKYTFSGTVHLMR